MKSRKFKLLWLLFLILAVVPAAVLSSRFGMLYSDPLNIDTAFYDVDGDGSREQIFLRYGPTFGAFTLELTAVQNGRFAYDDVFHMPSWGYSHALTEHDGSLCICAENGDEKRYLEIGTADGHFTLNGCRSTYQGMTRVQILKALLADHSVNGIT